MLRLKQPMTMFAVCSTISGAAAQGSSSSYGYGYANDGWPKFSPQPSAQKAPPVVNSNSSFKLDAVTNSNTAETFRLNASADMPWLKAHAYSNPEMIAEYHHQSFFSLDRSPMPNAPSNMRLGYNVIKYWQGNKIDPFWIRAFPLAEAPGHFTFMSNYPGGPRGWLEYLSEPGPHGFPQYRYWFDVN